MGAVGIDAAGDKHPLAVVEGATENAATVQALLDNLIERGLDPGSLPPLSSSTAPRRSPRRSARRSAGHTPIQRCQVHKARNIVERLPKELHARSKALRQAWELNDAEKAEQLIRNLARRLEQRGPGVAASILEGIDEILTVARLEACPWNSDARSPAPTSSRT